MLSALAVSSTAMTLMACYGAPYDDYGGGFDGYGSDEAGWGETGDGDTGWGETDGGDTDTGETDTGEMDGGEIECDPSAVATLLDKPAPLAVAGTLEQQASAQMGSCGGSGPELVFVWTPPDSGLYRFTVDANFDSVLYLRAAVAGPCGEELACADNLATGQSQLITWLSREPVSIVVDSSDGGGQFDLIVEAVE